ncbi:MAG: hypothetical protein K2X87_16840 [Gemmataceae bacterium]|nr:hypothetical protein [Gemmataceae bacterium]
MGVELGPQEGVHLVLPLGRTAGAADWFESVLAVDPADEAARKGLAELARPQLGKDGHAPAERN